MRVLDLLSKFIGVGLIAFSVWYSQTSTAQIQQGDVFHPPSLVFVGLTLMGVFFFSYQPSFILRIFRNLFITSVSQMESQVRQMNSDLEELTEAFYRGGAKELKAKLQSRKLNPAWEIVVNQLEAKIPQADIRTLLKVDADATDAELCRQIETMSFISSIAPSIGVLGTVMGLIQLLSQLKDFASIGPNMSLALVTTLYGIFFAIIVLNPLTSRLEALRAVKEKTFKQAIFWIMMTEGRKPAFYCDPKYWNSQES